MSPGPEPHRLWTGQPVTLCISIAARPGLFGATVHNAGYRALGLNYVYLPIRVTDLVGAIAGVRALGIRGCSVTMPFKEAVLQHLDALDSDARLVGAVNTVVNEQGRLTGYNTDLLGVREVLGGARVGPSDRVVVLGAGGVARAILSALVRLGVTQIYLCARRPEAAGVARQFHCRFVPWAERVNQDGDVLINATPIGMHPAGGESPLPAESLAQYRLVVDLVATPPVTPLIELARRQGIETIDGLRLALAQAAHQFKLYTGHDAPLEAMREAVKGIG